MADKKKTNKRHHDNTMLTEAESLFKTEWFHIPADLTLQNKLRKEMKIQNRTKMKIEEYLNSKKETERVRERLLRLVKSEKTSTDDFELPNSEERSRIKYYHYIHQGVDIMSIAPINSSWIENILKNIPQKLKSRSSLMKTLISQVRDDFVISVKKSIIDFALQDYDDCEYRDQTRKISREDLREMKSKQQRSSENIEIRIRKNLFKIHPTVVRVSQLWFMQYRNMRIINVKELYSSDALELNQFSDWLSSQIELCTSIIAEKWIPSVFKIVSSVMEKKSFAFIKDKKLKKFYECLSTLMSLQLQTLCYKTISEYTNFICDVKRSPGFQVHVLYKNNKIIFNPSYKDFLRVFLSVYDKVIAAVSSIPRIETKFYEPNLIDANKLYLKPLILPEIIQRYRQEIEETLQNEWICPELKIQDFDDYMCLINGQSKIEVNKFLSEERDFLLFKEKVSYYHGLGIEIGLLCSKVETIASFEMHREHFISILINKSQATKDRFLTRITDTYQDACKRLNEEFQEIKDTLLKPPANTAELVQMKWYNLKLGTEIFFEMEDRLRETMNYILFVSDYVPLTSGQIKQNSVTFLWYRRINGILEENRNIIKERTKAFQDLLLNRIESFKGNLETYQKEVNEFQNYRDASELSKYLKKAQNLHRKFNAAAERIREFNEEEEAFGWMKTSYPKRDELVEKLAPYKKLYENCADYKNKYQIWTEAKVGTYEPAEIEDKVETFHCNIIELSKEFSSSPAPYALTNSIKLEVEQFQKHMSIVKTLGNPCLKERHWEKISEIVGFPLRVEEDLSLARILDYGFEEYVDKFQVISDSATKENCLEMKLDRMIAEWKNVKFEIAGYRDSGTFILTTTDEIQVLLDDHIVKTQMMKNSPYIKPFESTIHSWEEKLILLQEIIDSWVLVQKTWVYFEPIFTFSDIQHLIPEESKRFNAVDKIWKDIMKTTSVNTDVLVVINIEKMLERLNKCNTLLNMIQNGLTGFLEAKRSLFPRLYFLSNREILSIISNTRDPRGVQQYLKKCFVGVKNLRFNESGDIVSLISDLGEELNLTEIVDTGSKRGQVEKWLVDLERVMKDSVKQEARNALLSYENSEFCEWIDSWKQQILFLVTGVVTTTQLEKRLDDTAAIGQYLLECNEKFESMIASLVERVDMKKRYILVSLIILFLQNRNHIVSIIAKPELEKRSELSMYIQYHMNDENITLSVLDCRINYGCEYVGNFVPSIMTPTTDSCYKFIFTCHKYRYGVLLEGPAGSGKTELVKDFSRRVAQHCVIFACSEILDHSLIGMFFKGIISSDVWLCFDNLDVVNAAGLRIIEHHVTRIQQAVQFGDCCLKSNGLNGNVSQILFSNRLTFATACSAYSRDRFETFPLFRTYFRCFNFYRSEHKNIITVKLLLLGFKNYLLLAKKLETLLRIGDELFRSKNHFTNDLRSLDIVMKNIAGVKRCQSLGDEESILSNAVEFVYRPLFYADDWLLFKKLLSLTFENSIAPPLDEMLTNAVRNACKRENIVFDGNIFDKVEQLLNAMNHSAGVILLGDTFGGKSTVLKIVSTTLRSSPYLEELETMVINPKSVTVEQLFGRLEESNKKWVDGILSTYYRQFYESHNSKARKWLVFDGPMDASWMENLNSVLDGSRKLCLKSGESIPLGKRTNFIFETGNLSHVSPLTISRCSVVSFKASLIKWEYLVSSWLNTLPPLLSEQHKQHINSIALRFCRPLFYFIDNFCDELVYPVTKNHMIRSLCDIFDCFTPDFESENYMQSTSEIDVRSQLEGIFSFSCIWSLGGLLRKPDQENFDVLFRALQCEEFPVDVRNRFHLPDDLCRPPSKRYVYIIPDLGTVFDYQYIKEGKGKWKLWSDGAILNAPIPRELQFRQIVVPTKFTIRNQRLISLLADKQKTVMLIGGTASGKTTDITYFVNTKLNRSVYKPVFLNFTAGTTGNSLQRLISSKLEKRKKGVYGPPLGVRYVLFIDDMNAAAVDEYGVNSAFELLRHWIECGYWFNLDDASVVRLIEMQLLGAATTNSSRASKTSICPRFLKYCTVINNELFDDDILKSIFSKIMLWHLDTRGFSKEFDPCIEQIVDATLNMHRRVQKHLLSVPEKSHYIFNLRDLAKIIQGIVLSVPEAIEDLSAMKRLWIHEVTRIYHDRIIDSRDSDWFMENLRNVTRTELVEELDVLLQRFTSDNDSKVRQQHLRKLVFCDFINPKADIRNYAEVHDMDSLQSIVEGYLTEYNNVNKCTMNLLLFSYSIEHLSRMCRIIKQPQGHALLLGEYGSGKQSLARLAIHMCEYELFEIEFCNSYNENDWREDMKNLLLSVYTDQHSAFLCTNFQFLSTFMLEDLSNLLQYAEIPEIFSAEEKAEIYEKMEVIDNQRDKALQTDGSHEALFNFFLQRIKKQIHVVTVVNLSIYDFRKYSHQFPAFVNCCTMDWFEPWSEEIQNLTARKLLHNLKCEYNDLQSVIELCNKIHNLAKQLSAEIRSVCGINVHFTQKSFIRLITTFQSLFTKKQTELQTSRKVHEKTLLRLASIEEQIPIFECEHERLQPLIHEKKNHVNKLEAAIEVDREIETEGEISLNGAKTVLKNCEKRLNVRKLEYEKKLKELTDAHENVVENLQLLSSNDIAVLKSMKNPPRPVKLVAEALIYIKELKSEKMQESGKVMDDFWKPAVKLIGDSKFIDTLINFDMSEMSARVYRLLEERIISHEDFDSDKIKSYSMAAEVIYKWISIVYEFNKVTKMDSEVRMNLSAVEDEYEKAKGTVVENEKRLEEARTKRENLLGQLDVMKEELDRLETEERTCDKKNVLASELVRILDKKKESWLDNKRRVEVKYKTLIGDVLLCSAVLTYLTAVPQKFRNEKISQWFSLFAISSLTCRDKFQFSECLLDEMELEEIKLASVLEDEYFAQILAIVRNSSRYPLLIDPYGLMTSWLRNIEHGNDIMVVRSDHEDYLRNLENAISSGSPVLLEHVDEKLDPLLYSVFEKQCFKNSTGIRMKIGKNYVEYNSNFKMYLSSEMQYPQFNLEVYEKLTVVNCFLEKDNVKNYLLKTIVKKEKPDLETSRQQTVGELLKLKKISAESEMKILSLLTAENDILEAENDVNFIAADVMLIEENTEKIDELNAQLESTNETISQYNKSAKYFADLFDILESLHTLNSAYQFSLKWYKSILIATVERMEKSEGSTDERLVALSDMFLRNFYTSVSQSLTKTDKLVFAYLLSVYTADQKELCSEDELNFCIQCFQKYFRCFDEGIEINPAEMFAENMSLVNKLENFGGVVVESVGKLTDKFHDITLPNEWQVKLNAFRIMLLKNCFFSEKITESIRIFTEDMLKESLELSNANLSSTYKESKCCVPISILAFDASDPTQELFDLAASLGISCEKCHLVTVCESENFLPGEILDSAKASGSWVIVRNLQHIGSVSDVEKVFDALTPSTVHPDFRLWIILRLGSACSEFILKNSFSVAFESLGFKDLDTLKRNLSKRLSSSEEERNISNIDVYYYKNLVAFHAMLADFTDALPLNGRIKFDELDFQIAFNEIRTCTLNLETVKMNIPQIYATLRHSAYGPRITNEMDTRYLLCLKRKFWNEEILTKFLNEELDVCNVNDIADWLSIFFPTLRGVYDEMMKLKQVKETETLIYRILKIQGQLPRSEKRPENMIEIIDELVAALPQTLKSRLHSRGTSSKDIFIMAALVNEVEQYNALISQMKTSVLALKESLKGYSPLTNELEILLHSLKRGLIRVHSTDRVHLFDVEELESIVANKFSLLSEWLEKGIQECDLAAVQQPRHFFLFTLLQYCQDQRLPINRVDFDNFTVLDATCTREKPDLEIRVRNLLLSNARWNSDTNQIMKSKLKSNHDLPTLTLVPRLIEQTDTEEGLHYVCPVYKVENEFANDHQTQRDFVISIAVPSAESPDKWIKRRVNSIIKK